MSSECRARVKVGFSAGLHARPATALARLIARRGKAKVRLIELSSGFEAQAESILSILALGAEAGAELEVVVRGEGAASLLDEVVELLEGRLGEEAG